MKAAAFDYVRARTVEEATALLASGAGAARVLAGGQSLGPMLNLRLARPRRLVDIKRAEGLRRLEADDAVLSIGAGFTHAEIEDGAVEDPARGLLRHVAGGIAYRAVRNRGTLGGSLAHADPAADWVSTMAALGAVIVACSAGGRKRQIAADGLLRGAFATSLGEDEVLAAIEVPRLSAASRWGYHKICRKTGEFAKAIGVAVLDPGRGIARVLAGAVEGAPVLLPEAAARLRDAGPQAAAEAVGAEVDALLRHLAASERVLRSTAVRRAILQLEAPRGN
jgi:aerobic carbon-monoxide dehydrogenase medium subunit